MLPNFTFLIEVLGTISFAMSGSFAAMQKRFDPFGVLIIAFVTSVGGGTVRDLLLDVPVFWMHDLLAVSLIFFTAIFTMIFKLIEKKFQVTLFIFDSLGLGLFTITMRNVYQFRATRCPFGPSNSRKTYPRSMSAFKR